MSHWLIDLIQKSSRTLAVIGTAGRREDGDKLTWQHWIEMLMAVTKVIEAEGVTHLVSGGAAWADHAAVQEHLYGSELPLKLYLPGDGKDLTIAEYYHAKFTRVLNSSCLAGYATWKDVMSLSGITFAGGFKDRNSLVAADADVFLAMTFGDGPNVKDGGTADTVKKMLKRKVPGYHFDLNDFKLHKIS